MGWEVLSGKGAVAMPKVIRCPSCQARYQIADEMLGRKFKCSKCGQALQLGAANATQPAPAKASQPVATRASQPAQAKASQPATTGPSRPAPASRSSLLDEELAIEAAKAEAAAAAQREAELDAEFGLEKPPEAPKVKCPHCDFQVGVEELYCPACGLAMQSVRFDPTQRSKDEAKEWMYALAGIALSMLMSPLFFLGVQMVVGSVLAMLVTALEIYFLVAVGSFSLACRLFNQEPPEVNDIFRIITWSAIPANLLSNYLGETGLMSIFAGTCLAILVSAILCIVQLQMPVFASLFISICYNIFSAILTLVGILLLAAIFITMTPDGTPPSEPANPPAAAPGAPSPTNADGGGEPQAGVRTMVEPGLVLRWLEVNAA